FAPTPIIEIGVQSSSDWVTKRRVNRRPCRRGAGSSRGYLAGGPDDVRARDRCCFTRRRHRHRATGESWRTEQRRAPRAMRATLDVQGAFPADAIVARGPNRVFVRAYRPLASASGSAEEVTRITMHRRSGGDRPGTETDGARSGFRRFSGAPERRAERCPTLRSEEHTSELQSRENVVCRRLLENNN